MPIQETRSISKAECATCPDCEKILVLGALSAESKRPFVLGRTRGWVVVCRCGKEFPVRSAQVFQNAVGVTPVRKLGVA
ncbi:MAG TPA: hypothetical protein VK738_17885 [Terriglobales bacterium]|jgi:hypothetical protein|nr:hypothetical protein [Terriglobales bacterium]